jgi:hypothetical protein
MAAQRCIVCSFCTERHRRRCVVICHTYVSFVLSHGIMLQQQERLWLPTEPESARSCSQVLQPTHSLSTRLISSIGLFCAVSLKILTPTVLFRWQTRFITVLLHQYPSHRCAIMRLLSWKPVDAAPRAPRRRFWALQQHLPSPPSYHADINNVDSNFAIKPLSTSDTASLVICRKAASLLRLHAHAQVTSTRLRVNPYPIYRPFAAPSGPPCRGQAKETVSFGGRSTKNLLRVPCWFNK